MTMGSGSVGKRSADQLSTAHVSVPSYVIPKRPRSQESTPHANPFTAVKPMQEAWKSFKDDIDSALSDLRQSALEQVTQRIRKRAQGAKLTAVCVKMGAAAAAGDRTESFNAIVDHVCEHTHYVIVRLYSAHHSSISSVTQKFDAVGEGESVLVALEDADLFPEDTLRDIIYVCAKRQAGDEKPGDGRAQVALLLGLGNSVDALHSALGIQEAATIDTKIVEMPSSSACFKVIVQKVLSSRKYGLELSQAVYDALETEFFARECTINAVMRALHQVFTLHFCRQPLAAVFPRGACPKVVDKSCERANPRAIVCKDLKLSLKDCLHMLRNDLASTREELTKREALECTDEELCAMIVEWTSNIRLWKARCRVAENVVYQLLLLLKISEIGRSDTPKHFDLRIQVFRTFLMSAEGRLTSAANYVAGLIRKRISKAGRQLLLDMITTMNECIPTLLDQPDEEMDESLARLAELKESMESADTQAPIEDVNPTNTLNRPRRNIAKGGAAARQRRREFLRNAGTADRNVSTLKEPREKLCSIFTDMIDHADGLCNTPLHELILFSDISSLQTLCGGLGSLAQPRQSFFTAMRNPSTVSGPLSEDKTPDTAIAYRLLAEGGRLKNLYDWYNAFTSIRTAGNVQRDETGKIIGMKQMSQAELQVRFGTACSELELLGLFKYTNRKTDHALRLVFE